MIVYRRQMLKTKPMLAETETAHVRDMVYVVIHKLKYDDEYDFQAMGEDEAMFQEYRYIQVGVPV